MALRWGICSTGKICNDFCSAVKTLPESEHQIVSVVSRTSERAKEFAARFGISMTYSSYEEFAKDPNIDVVYIGSITQEHIRLCLLMLNAGKHVLCEKPLTLTTKYTKMLNAVAKEKNVFFMEAVWGRCFPVYKKIKESIANGDIGEVHMVRASFNVPLQYSTLPPLSSSSSSVPGMLHDIGLYTIQFVLFVYGEMPTSITAVGDVLDNGYDVDGCIIFTFSKGQKACCMYSSKVAMEGNSACIYGTKGCIEIEDTFWAPKEVTLPSGKFTNELPEGPVPFILPNSSGLRYEAMEVRKCVQEGLTECSEFTHKDSEMMHSIMDEVAKQIGTDLQEHE